MEERYPSLVSRLQSSFIDLILIIILMFVFSTVLENFTAVPNWIRIALFVLLFVAYEPLCTSLGFTLGNFIIGIRVRKEENTSKRITIFQAIIRYIFKFALGWLSFVTIHGNPQKRAIHDIVAGSVMIKV
jgi:uncharacterized RDD family membrane protein YckC